MDSKKSKLNLNYKHGTIKTLFRFHHHQIIFIMTLKTDIKAIMKKEKFSRFWWKTKFIVRYSLSKWAFIMSFSEIIQNSRKIVPKKNFSEVKNRILLPIDKEIHQWSFMLNRFFCDLISSLLPYSIDNKIHNYIWEKLDRHVSFYYAFICPWNINFVSLWKDL